MNSPRRRTTVGQAALAALVCAVALGVAATRSSAASTQKPMQMDMSGMVTHRQLAFRNTMRVLWEEHVTWTRLAIVSFAGGLPDLPATERRLLQNQADIGNAVKPFYGVAAGNRLTALLRQHILEAVQVLVDAKAGNQTALAADLKRWTHNANEIAAFLHAANPHNWPLGEMRLMMHRHLALTTDEAVAELQGKYRQSVRSYDAVEREILGMADMLSIGIIHQFPGRFS